MPMNADDKTRPLASVSPIRRSDLDDDPIGDACAVLIEAIEEHGGDVRYTFNPVLAGWLQAMSEMLLALQGEIDHAVTGEAS